MRNPNPTLLLQAAGVLAWGLVAWLVWPGRDMGNSLAIGGALLLFLASFLTATRVEGPVAHQARISVALALLFIATFTVLFLSHNPVTAVLLVISVAVLAGLVGVGASLAAIAAAVAGLYILLGPVWHQGGAGFQALLYGSFMMFAVFSAHQTRREQQAREELARLMSELKATQHLLTDTAREAERLSIARDLHDTLGHHLTALSLQLEIAGHLSGGDAKVQVDKAKQLAKLLLADVRATVSDLRERGDIDLPAALTTLVDNVPRLPISLTLPQPFPPIDPARAEVLLRAAQEIITNTLRHAHARHLRLRIEADGDTLVLLSEDDGRGCKHTPSGNGLRGLQERVVALGGNVRVDTAENDGFRVRITLPGAKA